MSRKTVKSGNQTLSFETNEVVTAEKPLTVPEEKTYASDDPARPLLTLDTSFQEGYCKSKGLTYSLNGWKGKSVCVLTDIATGKEVVGFERSANDAIIRPHCFGDTFDRAMISAVEYHKRMVPVAIGPQTEAEIKAYVEEEEYLPIGEGSFKVPLPIQPASEYAFLSGLKEIIRIEVQQQLKNSDSGLRSKLKQLLKEEG